MVLTEISRMVKIKVLKKFQQDIKNDPVIRDQIANLGYLLMCTFGNFLAPVFVAARILNKTLAIGKF